MFFDFLGLGLSYLFVFALILGAGSLRRRDLVDVGLARKLIHIGVAQWWLIYMAFIHDPYAALLGPVSFIIINTLVLRFPVFKALENPEGERNLGTVYYPLTLLVLVVFCEFCGLPRWMGGVGVLVMGWGDGLAAVVGQRKPILSFSLFGNAKSLGGTFAMATASALVSLSFIMILRPETGIGPALLVSLAIALAASLVELLTPWGMDNLSVPLAAVLMTWLFFAPGTDTAQRAGWFLLAFGINLMLSVLAWLMHGVKASGMAAGLLTGSLLLWLGGWAAWFVLLAFFLSSTLLGKLRGPRHRKNDIEEKGSRRDGLQVFANCGPGLVFFLFWQASGWSGFLVAFGVAFAAATADTWASEVGPLNPRPPRNILNFKVLEAGSSGGVSLAGFLASAVGAFFIALVFGLAFRREMTGAGQESWFWILAIGGFTGAALDSVLGAGLQARYLDTDTARLTERPVSLRRGLPNILVGGMSWINNDGVNFVACLAAGLLALGIHALLGGF